MEVTSNKFMVTKCHIEGAPDVTHFAVKEEMVPLRIDKNDHTTLVIVKNLYVSVDPYMLNLMKTQNSSNEILTALSLILPGHAIPSIGVGRVLDSVHRDFKAGDLVLGMLSWAQYTIVPIGVDPLLQKVDDKMGFPLSYYTGILGYSGITAYGGFFKVCKPKKGEKVFVSSACGSVGNLVGQYAKLFGCYVVGCAGTKQKVKFLKEELGFDEAFNYKEETNLSAALQRCFPEGIDIYFDNVGGEMLEAVVENMNTFGRVAVCGVMSEYADSAKRGFPNMLRIIYKRIKVEGFILLDMFDVYEDFFSTTTQHLKAGKMKVIEDISHGVESIPGAFVDIFRGNNIGKRAVKIAEE
ncbi:NADP-dependent alkenal double bond reductase P2 [Striga hermonthica]|uniref:NADP-dependent alkenal double bond reductase P2 n=1 Tax=Striga hermonthica TaxID=68872 RepID=A0A9N7NVY6_STRHE|nr:NADP-dependent alkenal double bond reductase P2 [Striga hermonthica]